MAGKKIVMRTGEALAEADEAWSAAEPEVVIGELDGPVGYAIANAVLDAVREGHIPKNKVNDIGIIVAVWLDPSAADAKTKIDHEVLFKTHREATFNAIRKAMTNEPSIDWLLKNQKKVGHYFHELAVKGDL